ncbi:MAG: PcfJ domain-containing protein [Lachnospiraceae bacterium]|nr:PcfJ domain-containing protein [Lachnospiraceae bacterium]
MKQKEIEKIPWMAKKSGEDLVVVAAVHDIKGEETLIIDLTGGKPAVRICLTENDYKNYYPPGSKMGDGKKWDGKNVDNIALYKICIKKTVITNEVAAVIKEFAEKHTTSFWGNRPWMSHVLSVQEEINRKKREAIEKRRRDSINTRMKTVPAIPRDFKKWASKYVDVHQMAILPYGKNKTTKGSCSHCGKETEYDKGQASPGMTLKCPNCKKEVLVKRINWIGRNPQPVKEYTKEIILFQKTEEGFVERHFTTWKEVGINKEASGMYEKVRMFLIHGIGYTYYAKSDWLGGIYWDDRNINTMNNIKIYSGPIYPKTVSKAMFADTDYKYCPVDMMISEPGFEPIRFMKEYIKQPQLEMMVKVGLRKLALQICEYDFVKGNKPWELLGLEKKRFNRMRTINGGREELMWMKYEKEKNRSIEDEVIKSLTQNNIRPSDLAFIADRMTELKICNYLKKQCENKTRPQLEMIGTWKDYMSMANRLKMDTTVELIYKPKDLVKAHNEAVKLCGGQEVAKRVAEIASDYPDIDDIYTIKEKYLFEDEEYAIVVPNRIEDIVYEGRVLGHCLDSSDIYFDRIQRKESYIVFLRRKEDVEKPYYTLEIEPGGVARQKRTTGDKQNADFKEAKQFIKKWQKEIQRNLTEEDKMLAEQSARLRVEEFIELRKTKTKIWHGHLAGKLLVEVLEADLMELEQEERKVS